MSVGVDDDSGTLLLQMQLWIKEQQRIATEVEVLEMDSFVSGRIELNERFTMMQYELSSQLDHDTSPACSSALLFGGLDVAYDRQEGSATAVAVYVVMDDSLRVLYRDVEDCHADVSRVPYLPSFLAVRELSPLCRLVERQRRTRPELTPAVLFVDGNGVLHPRRAGLACAVGVATDLPTVGVGKNLYCLGGVTRHGVVQALKESTDEARRCLAGPAAATPPSDESKPQRPFLIIDSNCIDDRDETCSASYLPTDSSGPLREIAPNCKGLAVPLGHRLNDGGTARSPLAFALIGHGGGGSMRNKHGTSVAAKPIYISVGHRLSGWDAVALAVAVSRHRIPEPIRQADLLGRDILRRRTETSMTRTIKHK